MTRWTSPADVEAKLRRRWDSGAALRAFGEGTAWEPLAVPVRGPKPGELGSDLGRVQSWVRSWQRAAPRLGRLEYRHVGGRLVGVNELPAKVWIDSYEQLWSALGVTQEAKTFAELVADTRARAPRIVDAMVARPHRLLELAQQWPAIVDAVLWIGSHSGTDLYLRQVDVPGVDSKFIERHRLVLAELLDHQLPDARVDTSRPRSDFVGRYGFRKRPTYVKLRTLEPGQRLAGDFTEASVRLDELAAHPPAATTVYVIENETTYLAFPPVDDALALFGGGYAVSVLETLSWLADRDLVYWGDIDTHGFAILDRLRRGFPHAQSMLMDRATLLAHETQWVTEAKPHVAQLDLLQPAEAELYQDLVEGVLGASVRLEQERISYGAIERALATRAAGRINGTGLGVAASDHT